MDKNPDYAKAITGAFDHLLVDEYQDVNPGRVELIDRFVRAGVKLWAVGDDDQTLYAFRAADVRFILDFPRKYSGAQVHVLDRNYRSGAEIVAAAKRLIAHNRARRNKDYRPVVADAGEIVIRGYGTAEIEARQVALAIAKLIERGHRPQQIAVLYRAASVGLALQPALRQLQIPYEVRGAGDLWQGVAAKLVVGSLYYLRDGESNEAMSRMGTSKRAEITRSKLDQAAVRGKLSFADSCRLVRNVVVGAVPGQASERNRAEWTSVVEAVIAVASECGSLAELEAKIAEQSAALRQPAENAVVLSTIHSAKGLEWEAVFVTGLEQGVLPHANNDDLEEERRVAYVAITRAKRLLGLTYANERFRQGNAASQFLSELAGKGRNRCIWSDPHTERTDGRLPLLSNHERRRLQEVPLPQPAPQRRQRASKRRATEQDRTARNKAVGVPDRHGTAWNADEDHRLRTEFQAGEAIATIAAVHRRKPGAITARLIKLDLITEDGVVVSKGAS